jgi:HSP20 family molecular chaperone IbpA
MDELERTDKQELQEHRTAPSARALSRVYMPRVDIYEQDDETVLVADMPGVDENSVDITLEKNVLTIKGYVEDHMEGYGLAYSEYGDWRLRADFRPFGRGRSQQDPGVDERRRAAAGIAQS